MFSVYVRSVSVVLWLAVMATITYGVCRGFYIVVREGSDGAIEARRTVGAAIVSGLGLTTAIALLATVQLRSWDSIGLFTAAAALRFFVKFAETHMSMTQTGSSSNSSER